MGKSNKFLSKAEVAARYTGETKYNSVTVPQVFTSGEESIIDSASASLLKELDTITIIANKQILGKSEWSDVGNTSGVAPTTTTTTAAPTTTTTTTEPDPHHEGPGREESEEG